MASQQQNPWHNRSKQSTSRTPQNRSNTASPSPAAQQQQQQQQSTPTPTSKPSQPPGNFWAQRANQSRESSNGRSDSAVQQQQQQSPATSGFNAAEVKVFLARDAAGDSSATYKVQEAGGKGNGGGNAKGANKNAQTASNQPFFALLAKQIATLEGGG